MAGNPSSAHLPEVNDTGPGPPALDPALFERLIDTSPQATAIAGLGGRLSYVNQAFVDLWRIKSPRDVVGCAAAGFWDRPEEAQAAMSTLHSQGCWQGELHVRLADGALAELQLSAHLARDPQGQPVGMMMSFLDITAHKQMEQALQQERDFAASLVDTAPVIILLLDTRGIIEYVNPYFERLTGYRLEEIRGKEWFSAFLPGRDQDRIRVLFDAAKRGVQVSGNVNPILTRSGQECEIEWNDQAMRGPDGRIVAVLAIGQDVTERKRVAQALAQSESLFRTLAQVAPVGIFHTDPSGWFTYVNEQWCEIAGVSREAALGQGWSQAIHPDDRPRILEEWTQAANMQQPFKSEFRFQHPAGQVVWVVGRARAEEGTHKEVLGYVGTITDITERKTAEEEIRRLAFYDPLTGLPNRRLLLDRLKQALASSARSGRRGALLFIDLDNFKILNDTRGHEQGDLLLRQVGERLVDSVREGDTVARLGGDEFVVMLENLDEHAEDAIAQTHIVGAKILTSFHQVYWLGGQDYRSTPSIGATLFKGHQKSIDELMRQADLAMYQAKAAGRNALRFFVLDLQDSPPTDPQQPGTG